SLVGLIAEVANEPAHIGDAHAKSGAGLRDDVLLDHDATQIIGTEFERDLADLLSLSHPRALDARDIIEVNSRECLGPQIFMSSNGWRPQLRMLGLEGPADERGETGQGPVRILACVGPAFVLLRANAFQVFNTIFYR